MSNKRKFDHIKPSNPEEIKQDFLDFEQKFKMVKKTIPKSHIGTNKQTDKNSEPVTIVSSTASQTTTCETSPPIEIEEKENNQFNKVLSESQDSETKTSVKKQTTKKEKDNSEARKKKTASNEAKKGLTFVEWMQKGGEEVKEAAEKETQAKARGKGKGPGTKFNRNRSEIEHLLDDYEHIDRQIELSDGKITENEIIISSWNVNGLKRLLKSDDLQRYIKERELDIICLNETKLADIEFDDAITNWIPEGYTGIFNCCKIRNGYSGTAIITKFKPISVKFDLGIRKHDLEGRTITAEFEKFYLVASYWPNSGEGLVGLRYRADEWDLDFRNYVNELCKKKHVIICGDLNCCHQDSDLFKPKAYENTSGCTPQERKNFTDLLDSGFVDTFRNLYPETKEYSYYSISRAGVRSDTKGWRLDYFLVDRDGASAVRDSMMNHKVFGSNHLPVEIIVDPQFRKCDNVE